MKTCTKYIITFFIYVILFSFDLYASDIIYSGENATSNKTEYKKGKDEKNYEDDDGINIIYDEANGKIIRDVKYPVNQNMKDSGIVEEAVKPTLSNSDFVRKTSENTILSLDEYYKNYIEKEDEYLYINHTNSITIINDKYDWHEEIDNKTLSHKWTLTFDDYNNLRYAKSGFYRINNKTYYFDENGYMYIGKIKDNRDIIYEFGEDGAMME